MDRRTDRYREQLALAVGAVVFRRGERFLWRGASPRPLPRRTLAALSPAGRHALTLQLLREHLYEGFYTRGGLPREDLGSDARSTPGEAAAFVSELSRANTGVGSWERGWTCLERGGDVLTVERNGLTLRAEPGDVALDRGVVADAGSPLALRVAKEWPRNSPGYYFVVGNEPWGEGTVPMVRVYWNLMPAGAPRLIRAITMRLNDARLGFRIKALNDPAAYTRCDAAVLYLRKDDYGAASAFLAAIHRDLRPYLKAPIPAFTKELAPGLGLAEDPGAGGSFGMDRCRLIAEGLLRARDAAAATQLARIEIVETHLGENGIDLRKPYLNPGAVDGYDFPASEPYIGFPWRQGDGTESELLPAELLLAASRIGEYLAESAIRVGDRVGWVGPEPSPERLAGERASRYSALGPDLYAGTSGIALFLAELSVASGARALRTLAIDAADHALTRAEARTGPDAPGLFEGWSGVALAGARVGFFLREPKLLSRARRLVERRTAGEISCEPYDLISGKAGLILALLILSDLLEDRRLMGHAARLGDVLLGTAERQAGTLSWRDPGAPERRNLTGFSHGAAGAAYSLLELFRATGEARFREGAASAIAYEQSCFSPRVGNWPDFRKRAASAERRKRAVSYPSHWCHGAAGIALSRLRAWELLGAPMYEEQARVALATAAREAEGRLSWGTGDFSLCHGLAGDAEVLLCASSVLAPSTTAPDRGLACRLAAAIIHRLELLGEDAPPIQESRTLGLMSGLAGAGYFFLRLRDERVPSVLMLRREPFSAGPHLALGSNPSASQTSGC